MSERKVKGFTLRIDPMLSEKFHAVCDYEGRSANQQILQYIKKAVASHEEKFGIIPIKNEDEV